MMGSLSVWHWLIVLVIVMLVFGTKKIGNMGADLGKAVKGFNDGMRSDAELSGDQDGVHVHSIGKDRNGVEK